MAFSAENTFAVVVGVEAYEISEGRVPKQRWDLDGPASDVVRFVKWLTARHVPGRNIHVFLSSLTLQAHEQALRNMGVENIADARQGTLEKFFLEELPALRPAAAAQFFLLWGGHGMLRSATDRHLYCADVLPHSMRTIYLNDLLDSLRHMPVFARQFVFVDACANAHEDTRLNPPTYHPFHTQGAPSGVEQYVFGESVITHFNYRRLGSEATFISLDEIASRHAHT
jgi:hypothetical protein